TAPFSPPSRLPNPEPSESHNTTPVSVFLRHGLVEKHASPTPVLVCLDSSRSRELLLAVSSSWLRGRLVWGCSLLFCSYSGAIARRKSRG
ncbi:STYKc, partial [Musa troglodytarum]